MYTVFDMSGVIYMAGWIEWINEMEMWMLSGDDSYSPHGKPVHIWCKDHTFIWDL